MTRKAIAVCGTVAALGALAFFGAAPALAPPERPSPARPNIVLILTDDMDVAALPHLRTVQEQIGGRGTTFRNAFVTTPVCAPSRASILTGRYAHNHGLVANRPPQGGYRVFLESGAETSTVGPWLRAAGYRTAFVGKYINRYPTHRTPTHVPPGWDQWHGVVFPDAYFNYRINDNGRVSEVGERENEYLTDVLRDRAVAFLEAVPAGQPFFIYIAPLAPHAPSEPAPRHQAAFAGLTAPRPPSFDEEDVSDKPSWIRVLPRLSPAAVGAANALFRRRVQSLLAVDELVGRVLDVLSRRGLLQNTYVVFTSDNGFALGGHRVIHGKDGYDESVRVPLLVRGPGVPEGRVLEHFALNIDLAPTFAALAGAPVSPSVDGRSLTPLFGPQPPAVEVWRQDFLVEFRGTGKGTDRADTDDEGAIPPYRGLRTSQHAYTEYEGGERELYDMVKDPHQLQSLHATADRALLEGLRARMEVLARCSGDGCR